MTTSKNFLFPWLQGTVLYLACLMLLLVLIFATPGFVGTDDYYHARISSQIIQQQRLSLEFPWLPKTILSPDRFVDHHLLFHLYLAPWVYWAGMTGAKVATAGIAAGVFVAAWAFLRSIGTRYPAIWAVAIFSLSSPFLYRMLMVRTQGASLLLLIVTLHILVQRRYKLLIALGFAYAWLYDGFILLPIFATAYVAALWITERRFVWRPLVYSCLGIVLGLVVNPYFPHNLEFIADHLGAKTNFEEGARVGSEWYPYRTSTLLENSTGALVVFVLGLLWPSFSNRRPDSVTTTLLFIALLMLYMVFRSRRFIEYYPAFALLYCAASWGRDRAVLERHLPHIRTLRILLLVGVVGIATLLGYTTWKDTRHLIQDARDVNYLAGASAWLEENTTSNAMVFQTDWDDFPYLFYRNTHNIYLVGLDPTYLQEVDSELWDLWVAITRGDIDQPSRAIQSIFGADYVISDTKHTEFIEKARDDPEMHVAYRDDYGYVWEIVSPVSTQ